ncbi:fatty acid desaturase [Desulfovibrio ferrophilus]|uniref:Fatty acid desaturase n=1 Tax=Desulfovibrio ferrophilus TaxID=241368 RepID=A0A2Z6B1F7_9BACT|nr:fatty acid desaturase [Desulfovibrio ferrophilus]BBD09226.1 fatty acid desaturase [Desulfovibrio ferrophilus]
MSILSEQSRQQRQTINTLRQALRPYARAGYGPALWQLASTLGAYLALWVLMAILVRYDLPFWLFIVPVAIAAGLLVRLFIFFHDCTHSSFLPSRRGNRIVGYLTGALTFTPFDSWGRAHLVHHGTYGDLDRRGVGDIWTLTVEEYRASPWYRRLGYRLFRNPFVFLGVGPAYQFLVLNRLYVKGQGASERRSVNITNALILVMIGIGGLTVGWKAYLLIQSAVMLTAGTLGVWLFYVQHQFEGGYWARHEEWDPLVAAMKGCSYYKLPKVLQWITGNIGLHHVHHLLPRIPNYRLQECYDEIPALQEVTPLTLRKSLKSLFLNLWDEQRQRLVSFRALRST